MVGWCGIDRSFDVDLVMLKLAAALEQMKGKFKLENAGRCKHITHELYTIHASQLRTATSQAII